jgi:IclR family transcriptional regulator, KDG regulon repressor
VPMSAETDRGLLVKSLERAIDVIEAMSRHPGGVAVTDLARELGMPKSSAFRVLNTLRQRGYVRQDADTERYSLGPRFLHIAAAVEQETDLRAVAVPHLRALRDRTHETVHLAIPDGSKMVYLDKFESPQPVRLASRVGQQVLLHCTALGKAYLAALPETEQLAMVRSLELERRTDRTITDRDELLQELRTGWRRGFAVDTIENEAGVRCVGAALLDRRDRPVAAISVSAPTSRFSEEEALRVGPWCADTAKTISAELGSISGLWPGSRSAIQNHVPAS